MCKPREHTARPQKKQTRRRGPRAEGVPHDSRLGQSQAHSPMQLLLDKNTIKYYFVRKTNKVAFPPENDATTNYRGGSHDFDSNQIQPV